MIGPFNNYKPTFLPDKLDLNDVVYNLDQAKADLVEKASQEINNPTTLDPAVANLTQDIVAILRDDIIRIKKKTADTRQDLASYLAKTGSNKKLIMDISGNPFLKRLVRKAFGVKSDVITYDMYLEALAAKKQMETDDVREYTKGKPLAKK